MNAPAPEEPSGRLIGLDYGRRRIGVAVTDPGRTIASPHAVIVRERGQKKLPAELLELLESLRPSAVVVGIPVSMDGTEGEMAREAREFASQITAETGLRTLGWDERLSTARAERELRAMSLPRRREREKGRSDMLAAALMLGTFLRSGRFEEAAGDVDEASGRTVDEASGRADDEANGRADDEANGPTARTGDSRLVGDPDRA
ncbi:MAG: Holliday junction resolvase RuvX [Gemmatimonadota bacterium]